MIRTPATWILVPAPGPRCMFFFPFAFGWFFQTSTRGLFAAACCCRIFTSRCFVIFSGFFLWQTMCARTAWWRHHIKEAGQPTVHMHKNNIKVMVVPALGCATIYWYNVFIRTYIVLKQGADDIVHSPRYVNKQSTPTSTPVIRICSCVTLFYTYIVYLVPFFVRS